VLTKTARPQLTGKLKLSQRLDFVGTLVCLVILGCQSKPIWDVNKSTGRIMSRPKTWTSDAQLYFKCILTYNQASSVSTPFKSMLTMSMFGPDMLVFRPAGG